MNIAIVGVTGFRNRGVEALVKPFVDHFLLNAETRIQIATWSPEYDGCRISNSRVVFVSDDYLKCGDWVQGAAQPITLLKRIARKAIQVVRPSHHIALKKSCLSMPFDRPDVIVVSGGDLYSGDYGEESLSHFIEPLEWAHRKGVPSVLIGHSIGRFKTDEQVAAWRRAESLTTAITLRESLSHDYLVKELGLNPNRYMVTADTAFLLEPDMFMASQFFAIGSAPTVALSISANIAGITDSDKGRHEAAWLAVISMILYRWKANVVIIPHAQESFGDDRAIATRLLRGMSCDSRIRIFGEDLSAAEYKGLISKCDMLIAERMHAAIAGLSTGVTTVPIGYSIKAEGILTSVLEGTGIEPGFIGMPLSEFLDFKQSSQKLTRIWQMRSEVCTAIKSTIDRSKMLASSNLTVVDKLLCKS